MRQPIIIFPLVLFLFSLPFIFVSFYALQKAGSLETLVQQHRARLQSGRQFEEALAKLPQNWPRQAGYWVNPDYAIQQQLQSVMQQHAVTVQSIAIGTREKPQKNIERLVMHAAFTLPEEKLLSLLTAIEQHTPYLVIESLKLRQQGEKDLLYADAEIAAFRYQESP
jgi:hypothetical protein